MQFAALSKEILEKLNKKGWNLYAASFSIETKEIAAKETIESGPVKKLLENNCYVVLPQTENPKDPETVADSLENLVKKIGGKPLMPIGYTSIELLAMVPRKSEVEVPLEQKNSGKYKTVTIPINTFLEGLNYFLDTKKPRQINYSTIDQPIRKLIYTLDQIKFLRTLKSKAARIKKEIREPKLFLETGEPSIYPDDNNCFISRGYIKFRVIDIFDINAQGFMKEIKTLSREYSFVTISYPNSATLINCDCRDLTKYLELKAKDDTETKIRKEYEAKEYLANKRIKEFCEFRDKMMAIAEKYIEN